MTRRPTADGTATVAAARVARGRVASDASQRRAGIAFALPVIVLELLLLAIPIAQAAYFSFTRWDGITSKWIGPANYQRLFSDPTFWRVVVNNLLLLASVPFAILIPLLVAYLLNEHVRAGASSAPPTSCRRRSRGSSSAWWRSACSPAKGSSTTC